LSAFKEDRRLSIILLFIFVPIQKFIANARRNVGSEKCGYALINLDVIRSTYNFMVDEIKELPCWCRKVDTDGSIVYPQSPLVNAFNLIGNLT
jgi:hypothetical protein